MPVGRYNDMNTKAALGNYYNRSRIFFNLCHLRISKRNSKWLEWFTTSSSTSNWPVESGGSMDGSLLGPSLFLAGRLTTCTSIRNCNYYVCDMHFVVAVRICTRK